MSLACFLSLSLALLAITDSSGAMAGDITVAVAANFAGTLEQLRKDFEATGDHKLLLISGATGKFTTQIMEGAPFDVFLSADDKASKKLIEGGQAIPGFEFTYAIGTLALYSADPQLIKGDGEAVLRAGTFSKLAIANPKLAPYGVAAEATMKALGIYDGIKHKIVMGENIGQTFGMIDSGSAGLGFVALSQVLGSDSGRKGSYWSVPASLHEPIKQNVVLLSRAKNNPDARAFLEFLQSAEAREKIKKAGYSVEY
jgi:molybdate transport system substrate-binding protein